MTTTQRDLIDRIGRILVVAVLIYVTAFAIAYLVGMLQMSIHPLLLLVLSIAIVGGGLGTYYYRQPEKSFL